MESVPTTHDPRPRDPRRKPAPAKGPSKATVFWLTVSSFAALFGFLVHQLKTGQDPAIGAGPAPPKPVLMRNVVKRKIVTTVVPDGGSGSASPVVTSSGSAPAATAAPAAPVTTSSS